MLFQMIDWGKVPERGVAALVSREQFEQMFYGHNPFYLYDGFIAGANAAAGFGTTGDFDTCVREVAAFLANAAHETSCGKYVAEVAVHNYHHYSNPGHTAAKPAPGKYYYGRGWLQVTHLYNYVAASEYIYGDSNVLVLAPDILEQDAAISTQASLWYWMTQCGPSSNTAHDAMVNGLGFGGTIRAINGTLECDGGNTAQVRSRVHYFEQFLEMLSKGSVKPVGENWC